MKPFFVGCQIKRKQKKLAQVIAIPPPGGTCYGRLFF